MKIRFILTALLLIVVLVFAAQNAEVVDIQFLFWTFSLSRALLIFLMLMIGVVIGWFSRAMYRMTRITEHVSK